MSAVMADKKDGKEAGDSTKQNLNGRLKRNANGSKKSIPKVIKNEPHLKRLYIMDKKLVAAESMNNLAFLDIAFGNDENSGKELITKFIFDIDSSEFYQISRLGGEEVSSMLQDGTFIRKNKVYTITKYSTVILLLKILLQR